MWDVCDLDRRNTGVGWMDNSTGWVVVNSNFNEVVVTTVLYS